MKTVIIVSRCSKITRLNTEEDWHEFHFKGVCSGEILKKLLLRGRKDFGLKKGQEYLLYVQMISFDGGVFRGLILKARNLDECWDKS